MNKIDKNLESCMWEAVTFSYLSIFFLYLREKKLIKFVVKENIRKNAFKGDLFIKEFTYSAVSKIHTALSFVGVSFRS